MLLLFIFLFGQFFFNFSSCFIKRVELSANQVFHSIFVKRSYTTVKNKSEKRNDSADKAKQLSSSRVVQSVSINHSLVVESQISSVLRWQFIDVCSPISFLVFVIISWPAFSIKFVGENSFGQSQIKLNRGGKYIIQIIKLDHLVIKFVFLLVDSWDRHIIHFYIIFPETVQRQLTSLILIFVVNVHLEICDFLIERSSSQRKDWVIREAVGEGQISVNFFVIIISNETFCVTRSAWLKLNCSITWYKIIIDSLNCVLNHSDSNRDANELWDVVRIVMVFFEKGNC